MKQISLICLLIAGLNSLNAQEKNNWAPEQTIKHKTINTVRVSPDGQQTVYAVRELKLIDGKNEYINHLHLTGTDKTSTVRLTQGEKNNLNPNLIGVFYFLIFEKNIIMSPNLKELIDTNQVSEIEVVEFIATLRKLSHNNVLDNRNYKLVLEHFGLKKKKGWIKFGNGSKYKI